MLADPQVESVASQHEADPAKVLLPAEIA